jgi:peptide/nickel transport system substrate-binding protein
MFNRLIRLVSTLALIASLSIAMLACSSADESEETTTDTTPSDTATEETATDTVAEEVMEEETVEEDSMAEEVMEEVMEEVAEPEQAAKGTVHITDDLPQRDGVLRVIGLDIDNFDPDEAYWRGYSIMYDTLTHWYRDHPLVVTDFLPNPELAESWEFPDDRTIVFHLRSGVKYHDLAPVNGREMTAEDVQFSFERRLAPDSRRGALLGPVSSVNVVDADTVEFKFDEPFAPFMTVLSQSFFPVQPPEVLDEFGGYQTWDAMIGTGQYMIDDYEVSARLSLTRNEEYFRGPNGVTGEQFPYIEKFNIFPDPGEATKMAMYRSGLMDHGPAWEAWGFWGALDDHVEALDDRPDLLYHYHSGGGGAYTTYFYGPKLEGIWKNQKLRWAVALYNDISCAAWCAVTGGIQPARWVAAENPWFVPTEGLTPDGQQFYVNFPDSTMDIEKAKQYVQDAKTELGLPLDEPIETLMNIRGTDQAIIDIAGRYVADLAKIGIEAELRSFDRAEFDKVRKGEFEGIALMYGSTTVDADGLYYNRYFSESVQNLSGIDDPHMDQLILKGRSTVDPAVRKDVYAELQRYQAELQYDWAVPNWTNTNMFPRWIKNPGPQYTSQQGDLWLKAWIDMGDSSRRSHDWE